MFCGKSYISFAFEEKNKLDSSPKWNNKIVFDYYVLSLAVFVIVILYGKLTSTQLDFHHITLKLNLHSANLMHDLLLEFVDKKIYIYTLNLDITGLSQDISFKMPFELVLNLYKKTNKS